MGSRFSTALASVWAAINAKLPLTGGTLSGALTVTGQASATGDIRANTVNGPLVMSHGGSNAYLDNQGAGNIDFRIGGTTKLTVEDGAPSFLARAWAAFETVNPSSLIASKNVASITDLGTGNTRVNFSTAMGSGSFAAVTAANGKGETAVTARASGSVTLQTYDAAGGVIDPNYVSVAVLI